MALPMANCWRAGRRLWAQAWPRHASRSESNGRAESGETAQKLGGTLVIRAVPGRGLDLQHQTHHIIERINQFYGYGAMTSVKIVQTPDARLSKPLTNKDNPVDSETEKQLAAELKSIADEGLQAALQKLGSGALAKRPSSPQGK